MAKNEVFVTIRNTIAYMKLEYIYNNCRPFSTTEYGSDEWKKLYEEYYKNIGLVSKLIRELPTYIFYNKTKDKNCFIVECNVYGSDKLVYNIYKQDGIHTLERK